MNHTRLIFNTTQFALRCWATRIQLKPLGPEGATAALNTNLETPLAHAYTEYLEQYGRNDIHYWSSRLLAKRLTEDDESPSHDEEANVRIRAQTPAQTDTKICQPSSLRRPHRDDISDEENLRSPIPMSKKIKTEAMENGSFHSSPSQTSQSGKTGLPIYRGPPKLSAAAEGITMEAEKVEQVLPGSLRIDKVKIYIGNPYVVYSVKAIRLNEASPVLASYCQCSKGDQYIWSPWLSTISADDFRPVAEFVESGEYHPYIIDAGTERAHLTGISNVQDKEVEILKCGVIYTLACQFEMPKLQALVISKLKTLEPYPAEEFIAMSNLAFGSDLNEEDGLDKLIVSYIADNFFDLVAQATQSFNKLLTANGNLMTQVCAMKAGPPRTKPQADDKEPKIEAATRLGGVIQEVKVTNDEGFPRSGSDRLLELAADNNGIRIYEDEETKENTPPSEAYRVPLSERTDLQSAKSVD
ncbi:MAG: hypothetical protein Q9169_002781 [Polycauliona sp. 2 TL-2023]